MRGIEITAYLKSEKYTNAGRFKGNNSCKSLAVKRKKKKEKKPNPYTSIYLAAFICPLL